MRCSLLAAPAAVLAGVLAGTCAGSPVLAAEVQVLRAARIYPDSQSTPIEDGLIVIRDGRIAAVGGRDQAQVPPGARRVQCAAGVVVAGFQNSHVHFTDARWSGAAKKPAQQLAAGVTEMLTRYGFTTVLDTGSDPDDTLALRRRIEGGELAGPRILTAAVPLYPERKRICRRTLSSSCSATRLGSCGLSLRPAARSCSARMWVT